MLRLICGRMAPERKRFEIATAGKPDCYGQVASDPLQRCLPAKAFLTLARQGARLPSGQWRA